MKCAVIGLSSITPTIEKYKILYENFGVWCAKQEIILITGACDGVPYIIGKACVINGGQVLGYSPACNAEEHIKTYKQPIDGCSKIIYNDSDANANKKFILRSLNLLEEADIIVCFDGNWGTLNEIIAAIFLSKKIVICSNSGGISNDFEEIYMKLKEECMYNYGEDISFVGEIAKISDFLGGLMS